MLVQHSCLASCQGWLGERTWLGTKSKGRPVWGARTHGEHMHCAYLSPQLSRFSLLSQQACQLHLFHCQEVVGVSSAVGVHRPFGRDRTHLPSTRNLIWCDPLQSSMRDSPPPHPCVLIGCHPDVQQRSGSLTGTRGDVGHKACEDVLADFLRAQVKATRPAVKAPHEAHLAREPVPSDGHIPRHPGP